MSIKEPIHLDANCLSTMIAAMLLQQGKTEFTLSFDDYESLGLGDLGVECSCTPGDNPARPDSLTVTVVNYEEAKGLQS